jgi:hypothetical protein
VVIVVDIQTVSIVIASAGILIAAIYYILQIRHQTRLRQTDLIMRLYSVFGTPEFGESCQEILNTEITDTDYLAKSPNDASNKIKIAVRTQAAFYEGVGVLLHRKLIDTDLVDDLFSSPIIQAWEKLEPIIKTTRERRKRPQIWEWFEYLYYEMKKREQKLQQSKA